MPWAAGGMASLVGLMAASYTPTARSESPVWSCPRGFAVRAYIAFVAARRRAANQTGAGRSQRGRASWDLEGRRWR